MVRIALVRCVVILTSMFFLNIVMSSDQMTSIYLDLKRAFGNANHVDGLSSITNRLDELGRKYGMGGEFLGRGRNTLGIGEEKNIPSLLGNKDAPLFELKLKTMKKPLSPEQIVKIHNYLSLTDYEFEEKSKQELLLFIKRNEKKKQLLLKQEEKANQDICKIKDLLEKLDKNILDLDRLRLISGKDTRVDRLKYTHFLVELRKIKLLVHLLLLQFEKKEIILGSEIKLFAYNEKRQKSKLDYSQAMQNTARKKAQNAKLRILATENSIKKISNQNAIHGKLKYERDVADYSLLLSNISSEST